MQLFKGETSESNDFPNMNREISEKLAVNLPLGRSSTRIFQRGSEACHRNTRDILLPSPPQHGNFTAWKFSFPSSCSALPPFKCRPVFYPSTTKTTRTSTRTITTSALTEISFHIILQSTCIFRWICIITISQVKMSYFFTKLFQFLVCSYLWILTAVITKTNFKYSLCWHAVTVINYLKQKLVFFIFKN